MRDFDYDLSQVDHHRFRLEEADLQLKAMRQAPPNTYLWRDIRAAEHNYNAAIAKGWVDHLPKYYEPLKKRDRAALVNFLRKQQAGSIETLGLTDYWHWEPFPLELRK